MAKKEKLSKQFSITCSAGALAIVGVVSYMAGIDLTSMDLSMENSQLLDQLGNTSISRQLKVIYLGFPSAIILGMLGYVMGDILDNPRGKIPESIMDPHSDKPILGGSSTPKQESKPKPNPMITGDELFLDDLDFGDELLSPETPNDTETPAQV